MGPNATPHPNPFRIIQNFSGSSSQWPFPSTVLYFFFLILRLQFLRIFFFENHKIFAIVLGKQKSQFFGEMVKEPSQSDTDGYLGQGGY